MNILFTCAGRRNYLINYFKEVLGDNGRVIAMDMTTTAPALIDADIAVQAPSIYDSNYIQCLLDTICQYQVNAVISLNDLELPILANNKDSIEKLGARLIVSDIKVIDLCFDKYSTCEFFNQLGLKTPKTYISIEAAKNDLFNKNISFPLILKPRWGSASIGIEVVDSLDELDIAYKLLSLRLKKSILYEASKHKFQEAILIQEKIDGVEYGMDVVNDLSKNYYISYVRRKLGMRAGETDKAISIIDERFNCAGKDIAKSLQHIGIADMDIIEKNGELYFLGDINPRFSGGYPFSHESGINVVNAYVLWLKGESAEHLKEKYQENMAFAKCDRLVRI